MANYKLMPDPVDLREITFTNLLLLGFDIESNEAQYRIPFTRDMFAVPNRKAMEVIIHFLFTKLNNDSAKESFRNCWPIVDKRKEQEFRKICIEWLNKIKKDDGDCRLPTIVPSLLLSPAGDRFHQFLFYFSTFVLKQKISRIPAKHGKLPVWPTLSSVNRKVLPEIIRSLTISVINKKSRSIHYMESVAHVKEEWLKFSRELSKEYRRLSKLRRECEQKLKDLRATKEQIFGKSALSSKEILKRTQHLQRITEFWKNITKLFESEKGLHSQLEQIFTNNENKKVLDGDQIHFKVPDILLRECERQLQSGKRYHNLYEDGTINLPSLIQLWNLSLHLIKEAYNQYPLPDVEHDEAYIRSEAHNHANTLNRTVALSNTLAERTLPDLKLSIDELKDYASAKTTHKFDDRLIKQKKFNLDFLPSTPPVQFNPSNISSTLSNNQREINYQAHQPQVDTPDAVNVLLKQFKKPTTDIDYQDNTPIRAIPKNMKPHSTKKNLKVIEPASEMKQAQRKIIEPASERKKAQRKIIESATTRSETQRKIIDPTSNRKGTERKTEQKNTGVFSRIPKPRVVKALHHDTKPKVIGKQQDTIPKVLKTKAQQLLIDQIAQSVLEKSQMDISLSSDSDEQKDQHFQEECHALEDPMEAFSSEAFVSRDKVPRTPSFKKTMNERKENQRYKEKSPEDFIFEQDKANEKIQHATIINEEKMKDSFDLTSLQEKLQRMKMKDDSTPINSSGNDIEHNSQDMIKINQLTTPVFTTADTILSEYNPITPLKFSDDDDDDDNERFSMTPTKLSDVDFTPIKTPWRKDQNIRDTNNGDQSFVNTDVNIENFTERKLDESNALRPEVKSQLELFLENNKDILLKQDMISALNVQRNYDNKLNDDEIDIRFNGYTSINEFQTPSDFPHPNLINAITPFKSPFTPSTKKEISYDENPLNISAQDVDDFIEEVISNTSKTPKAFASLIEFGKTPKTPGIFGIEEPRFGNDYTLMTPGIEKSGPFRLDFSDDSDEI